MISPAIALARVCGQSISERAIFIPWHPPARRVPPLDPALRRGVSVPAGESPCPPQSKLQPPLGPQNQESFWPPHIGGYGHIQRKCESDTEHNGEKNGGEHRRRDTSQGTCELRGQSTTAPSHSVRAVVLWNQSSLIMLKSVADPGRPKCLK